MTTLCLLQQHLPLLFIKTRFIKTDQKRQTTTTTTSSTTVTKTVAGSSSVFLSPNYPPMTHFETTNSVARLDLPTSMFQLRLTMVVKTRRREKSADQNKNKTKSSANRYGTNRWEILAIAKHNNIQILSQKGGRETFRTRTSRRKPITSGRLEPTLKHLSVPHSTRTKPLPPPQ